MTGCYDDLVDAGVRTRDAAASTGLSKATQDRRRREKVSGVEAGRCREWVLAAAGVVC